MPPMFGPTVAALAAAALLAGCAPEDAEPVYFRHHIEITTENAEKLVGRWQGPYTPIRGGEGGVSTLDITAIEGTIARGRMSWSRDGAVWDAEDVMIGLGLQSHMMLELAHAEMIRQGPEHFIEAEMMLDDGNLYLHRLSNPDADFGQAAGH